MEFISPYKSEMYRIKYQLIKDARYFEYQVH